MSKWLPNTEADEYKLSEDAAKAQLAILFSFYEFDASDMGEDQQAAINQVMGRIARGIRLGKLEVKETEDGPHIIQHTKGGATIDYRPMSGKIKPKLDAIEGFYQKMYLLLGMLSGLGEDAIAKLSPADLKLAESISGFLFLA